MKRFLFILISIIALSSISTYAKDKDEDMYRYELEGVEYSSNNKDVVAVKVWSYGNIKKITRETCMRNAIHGVIFKGVPAASGLYMGQKAIVPNGYNSNKEYFDSFFESGDYLQYVELTNNGNVKPGDRIQISGKEYKIGIVCLVNLVALKKRLEGDNVAGKLKI